MLAIEGQIALIILAQVKATKKDNDKGTVSPGIRIVTHYTTGDWMVGGRGNGMV